ncbi:hypothetical protein BH11PLA2_BH11PLA2_22620 [soil metagenome]
MGWGSLGIDNFKGLIDANPQIRHVELSNWGEMFLNSDLLQIMEYAHNRNVSLSAMNGTNLNTISDRVAEGLVKYEFTKMRVSIDGATAATYARFRRRGNFDSVMQNIAKINRYKEQYARQFPQLIWVFISFSYNEQEIPAAQKMAEEMGMEFVVAANFDSNYYPIQKEHDGLGRPSIVNWEVDEVFRNFLPCYQMWTEPQINYDGKLLGCCANANFGYYGNVFDSEFKVCIDSDLYTYTQRMLLGEVPEDKESPCSKCNVYQQMREHGLHTLLRQKLETLIPIMKVD